MNIKPNVASALAYFFGFVSGIIFLLISKDKLVKFHAAQSIVFSGAYVLIMVFRFVPIIRTFTPLLGLAYFILWIFLVVKAYKGDKVRLPILGDLADSIAGK